MQLFNWLSCLLVAVVAVVAKEVPTELKINTTFLPSDCTKTAQKGDSVQVHYAGRLYMDDTPFDSSYDRNAPLPVIIGVGQVIRGWDEGIIGMCVGEKRTLIIPSGMAYGSRGAGGLIPPDSPLIFDVELMALEVNPSREEL